MGLPGSDPGQARLQGRWEMRSQAPSSSSSRYSRTGYSVPHDVQRRITVVQPTLSTTFLPQDLHFIRTPGSRESEYRGREMD